MKEAKLVEIGRMSVHGLQLIGRPIAKAKPLRVALIILLLMAVTLLGLQLKRVAEYYLEYPTEVDVKIDTAESMDFPAVTFCSLGIVNKDIVRKIPCFKEMEKVMNNFNSTDHSRTKRKTVDANPQPNAIMSIQNRHVSENEASGAEIWINNNWSELNGAIVIPRVNDPAETDETDLIDAVIGRQNVVTDCSHSGCSDSETNSIKPDANIYSHDISVIKQDETISQSIIVFPAMPQGIWDSDMAKVRSKRAFASYNCSGYCGGAYSSATYSSVTPCTAGCVPGTCLSYTYNPTLSLCMWYSFDCCSDPSLILPKFGNTDMTYVPSQCDSVAYAGGTFPALSTYYLGKSYIFACFTQYLTAALTTSITYTCTGPGTWDNAAPAICTAYCLDIFSTATGNPGSLPTYWTGTTVVFTCNAGYLTTSGAGSASYVCSGTSWNQNFAPCVASCPDQFPVTTTGSVNSPKPYFTGSTPTFNCITSYYTAAKLHSVTYNCAGTTWDKTFQDCLPHCINVFPTLTGVMSGSVPYPDKTTVLFTCSPGYMTNLELNADNYTCATTVWSPTFTPCIRTCPSGIFDTTGNTTAGPPYLGRPTTYLFTCRFQYLTLTKTRNSSYICQSDGTWNRPFEACIMECTQIHRTQSSIEIADSEPLIETFMPSGSNSTFSCIDGFSIRLPNNTAKANCYNGTWDLQSVGYPLCLQNCVVLDTKLFYARLLVAYDSINKTSVVSGTIASFTCNNSYFMYGDFNISTCVNGTWDVPYRDLPICLEEAVPFYPASFLEDVQDDNGKKDNLAAGSSLADMIAYIWSNMSDSMKYSLGFGKGDNVLGCTFDGRPCDSDNEIRGIQEPSLGNCYTFNHEFMNKTLQTSQLGERHGLHWIFDTKQENFLSVIATAGIKLIIHQQQEPLFVDSVGIVVSPGYLYNIRIRKESEIRAYTPKSECIDYPSQSKYYYYSNRTYQTEGCVRSYFQYLIMGHCHCASPHYPSANTPMRPCTLEDRVCADRFLKNVTKDQTAIALELCPQPCMDVIERRVVTVTVNVDNDPALTSNNLTANYIRQNVVAINVFYDSLEYKVYHEHKTYLFLNLATDIGSSIGLLLGMSAISIIEMISLPFRLRFLQ